MKFDLFRIFYYSMTVYSLIIFILTLNVIPSIRVTTIENENPTSMSPDIRQYDALLVKLNVSEKELFVGDLVLTYFYGKTITHRIVEILSSFNVTYYLTKGDNYKSNIIVDNYESGYLITLSEIIGKVIMKMPSISSYLNFLIINPQLRNYSLIFLIVIYVLYSRYFILDMEMVLLLEITKNSIKGMKKTKLKNLFLIKTILIFILLFSFIPLTIIKHTPTSINDVSISNVKKITDNSPYIPILLYYWQVEISFYRSPNPYQSIDNINLVVINNGTEIYQTFWFTYSKSFGNTTIGIPVILESILINSDKLQIIITLNYHILFMQFYSIQSRTLKIPN